MKNLKNLKAIKNAAKVTVISKAKSRQLKGGNTDIIVDELGGG